MKMKKNSILKLTALLLSIALVASAGGWWECRKKSERLVDNLYLDSLHSRLVLSDMADFLEHSIDYNASDAYLRLQLIRYEEQALFLKTTFSELYDLTHEEKYSILSTAMANVDNFLTDVSNDEPTKMQVRVRNNLETLRRIQDLFKELSKYQKPEEIPEDLTEELLDASRKLN